MSDKLEKPLPPPTKKPPSVISYDCKCGHSERVHVDQYGCTRCPCLAIKPVKHVP